MAGSKVPRDPTISQETRRFLDDISRQLHDADTGLDSKAALSQSDFISGIIKSPAAQDYRIIEKAPYAATLSAFAAKTSSGTVTATLKINSTAVTNGAINVTSTQGAATPTAANAMAAADALVMTLSSVSSAVDLSFTITYTRTLAAS
jgi:hypothetical protein